MQIIHSDVQDQLVKGLSHRMNNILTLFHGYLGLLLDNEELDPVTQEGLAKIKDSARIASELMDRTNALVRPTNLTAREISIEEFLNQLTPTFEKLRGSGPKVEVECESDLPLVIADPSRIRVALTELVKNACDATESGGSIRIAVSSGSLSLEEPFCPTTEPPFADWVVISVIDQGGGIDKSVAHQLYEPFCTTKKRVVIAGLGLTVAMRCMQQIGGGIDHESAAGTTTFRLTLPARRTGKMRAVA